METRLRRGLCLLLALLPMGAAAPRGSTNLGLHFRGQQFAEIPDNPVLDSIEKRDEVTIEAWIRIDQWDGGWFSIIDKYEKSVDFGWTFQVDGGGGFTRSLQFVGGIGPTARAAWVAPLHVWTHVAMSYRRSDGFIRFFVNGRSLSVERYSADIRDTTGEPLYLGFNPSGGDEHSIGSVDELRIWDHARTDIEIAGDWRTRLTGNEAGLVGYWPMDEGHGSVIHDRSPSGNDGTLAAPPNHPHFIESFEPVDHH